MQWGGEVGTGQALYCNWTDCSHFSLKRLKRIMGMGGQTDRRTNIGTLRAKVDNTSGIFKDSLYVFLSLTD